MIIVPPNSFSCFNSLELLIDLVHSTAGPFGKRVELLQASSELMVEHPSDETLWRINLMDLAQFQLRSEHRLLELSSREDLLKLQ